MVKKVLLVLLFVSFSTAAYAVPVPVSLTLSCESGTIGVAGTFDPANGAFSLTFTPSNCTLGDDTLNGTATSSGTVALPSSSTANITNMSYSYQLSLVGPENSVNQTCNGTVNGTYTFTTDTFQGNATQNCTASGSGHVSWLNLLMGILN